MAVKIRLKRMGAKKSPFYRVVVADSRTSRDGKFIEEIGTYNPMKDPSELNIKKDRVEYWIGNGAKTTSVLSKLLKNDDIK